MKDSIIAPSMMCIDYSQVTQTLRTFEKNGIGYLHIDIMDGEFVPNYTLGTDFCRRMGEMSTIPLDIHLMVNRPDLKLSYFKFRPCDYVSVHYESTPHIQRALQTIRDMGAKPMLALCPATPIDVLDYVAEVIDGVLIMTVNPGFAGQKLIPSTLQKIKDARMLLDSKGFENVDIEVDGNVNYENALKMRAMGANIFVGGTSSVFSKEASIEENIAKMKQAIK